MRKSFLATWFKWESKAQQAARAAKYSQRMFPLGIEQRDWERTMLLTLFPEKKKMVESLHYDLLVLRETIINAQLPFDDEDYEPIKEGMERWDKNTVSCRRGDIIQRTLKAMAYLEATAKSLEELPTEEAIRQDIELYK